MKDSKPRSALGLALAYGLIAGLYILISNSLLSVLTADPRLLTHLNTLTDGVFVVVTAVLLYTLIRGERLRLEDRDAQILAGAQQFRLQTAALESAANAIVITDHEGLITWVNPAFTRLTGYTAEETLGRTPRFLKSGNHHEGFYQTLWQTILSGQVWHGELINRRKDGRVYTEEQTITPVWDEHGEISHFIGIKQDVTERKQTEGALRESEGKYRNLVENTSDWVWEIDERNRYTYVSPKIGELLGFTPAEILGKTPFDLMPLEEAKRAAESLAPITGEMKPFVLLDNVCMHKDGHQVVLETSGTPIFDARGVFRGYRGIDRDVTERKRAEAALLARTSQLEAVRAVTAEITRELDLTALLELITRRAADLVGVGTGAVHLWDEAAQILVTRAWHGYEGWRGSVRLRLGEGVAGTIAQRREGMIVNDYRTSPYASPLLLVGARTTAILGEPLLYGDRLLGVIVVTNDGTERRFTEDDRHILGLFAAQAAVAIENARLHDVARRHAQQLATLINLTRTVTKALEPQAAAREILTAVQTLIPGAVGRLWERVGEQEVVRLVASIGLFNPEGGQAPRFRPGEGLTGIVAATHQPVISRDVTRDPRFLNRAWAAQEKLVSCIIIPLAHGERLSGILTIFTRAPHDFPEEEVDLLRSFAAQAAIAIENARLHDSAVRRGEELHALLRATRTVMAELDLREILERIVAEAAQMAGTSHVTVMLVDKAAQLLRLAALAGNPVPADFHRPLGVDLSGLVAQTGQPVFSADSPNDPRNLLAERDRELGFTTYLGLPIKIRDEVIGVLTFDTTVPRYYTAGEISYLELFAEQAAIAIENARLYEELRLGATRLAAKVEDRTHDLQAANAQLVETMRQLEAASRHKSEFLASMSHELRTPLNSILGFSQLLLEQQVAPLTEKQARFLGHIHKSGQHLLQLIDDILDLSRVEAGRLSLQPESLPIARALDDILVIARGLATKKTQGIETDIAPDLPPLRADPVRFKQILLNLLSNAVKFTPTQGRITLAARRASPAGNLLEIRVTDTGVGIRDEDLPRLFQEFVQLETTRAQRHEGTGLGLALTKRLVELHAGEIRAESAGEGQGATFTVLLPFGGPEKLPESSAGGPSP